MIFFNWTPPPQNNKFFETTESKNFMDSNFSALVPQAGGPAARAWAGRVQLQLQELGTLPFFGGGKSWTQPLTGGGQFRSLFFSGFGHIGKFGGGKKDQTPCIRGKTH